MMTDIEIAQSVTPKHITEIAKAAGIDDKYLEQYGKSKAKIDLSLLADRQSQPDGKLVLVTAITPTPAGEGKTTTTIGLADGLKRIGKSVTVALREPSLGPVFGVKGGAAGGGWAQAADGRRSSRWRTSTFISPATSTRSARQTTFSRLCSITISIRATPLISIPEGSPGTDALI